MVVRGASRLWARGYPSIHKALAPSTLQGSGAWVDALALRRWKRWDGKATTLPAGLPVEGGWDRGGG
ncbi:hypothetical protein YIM730264_13420 [Thermus hydrothermalis]